VIDLALDKLNYDLRIKDGVFLVVNSSDEIAQRVRIHLQRYLGEWFLNINLGVPYYQSILGEKDRTLIELYLRKEIGQIEGVEKIKSFEIVQNYTTRTVTVNIKITTVYGEDASVTIEA